MKTAIFSLILVASQAVSVLAAPAQVASARGLDVLNRSISAKNEAKAAKAGDVAQTEPAAAATEGNKAKENKAADNETAPAPAAAGDTATQFEALRAAVEKAGTDLVAAAQSVAAPAAAEEGAGKANGENEAENATENADNGAAAGGKGAKGAANEGATNTQDPATAEGKNATANASNASTPAKKGAAKEVTVVEVGQNGQNGQNVRNGAANNQATKTPTAAPAEAKATELEQENWS